MPGHRISLHRPIFADKTFNLLKVYGPKILNGKGCYIPRAAPRILFFKRKGGGQNKDRNSSKNKLCTCMIINPTPIY